MLQTGQRAELPRRSKCSQRIYIEFIQELDTTRLSEFLQPLEKKRVFVDCGFAELTCFGIGQKFLGSVRERNSDFIDFWVIGRGLHFAHALLCSFPVEFAEGEHETRSTDWCPEFAGEGGKFGIADLLNFAGVV